MKLHRLTERLAQLLAVMALWGLAACAQPDYIPTQAVLLTPVASVSVSAPVPATASATPLPATATITPTPTPTPVRLIICQTDEPASLYLYAEHTTSRASLLEALYDGPIDSVGFGYQPILIESLPSLAAGTARQITITVQPGDTVVDALTLQIVRLRPGVHLAQPDGAWVTYTGEAPATTVQLSADFTLRPDVRWSDGAPLTADDSVFGFEVDSASATPTNKFIVQRTASYTALDARTVRWVGLPGWRDTDFALRLWAPLPRHAYGTLSPADLLAEAQVNRQPLGWGAFVVHTWEPGRLTLTRNPHYFRAAAGLPRVDEVVFRFGLSAETILSDIRAGRCHIGDESVDFSAQAETLLDGDQQNAWRVHTAAETTFEHLDFGIAPIEGYRRPLGRDLLTDSALRRALAQCIDRAALQPLGGGGIPIGYMPSTHPVVAGLALTPIPFDPAQADAQLTALGWVDRDGDGLRDRNRQPLQLTLATGPTEAASRVQLAQALAAQMRQHCGVALTVTVYAQNELYDPWPTGVLFGRRFDLALFPWRAGMEPPCELYSADSIPNDQNPGGANNTGWANAQFTAACQAARRALDPAERLRQHQAALTLFHADIPALPLFFRLRLGVSHPMVQGYTGDSTTRADLWNIEAIGLTQP